MKIDSIDLEAAAKAFLVRPDKLEPNIGALRKIAEHGCAGSGKLDDESLTCSKCPFNGPFGTCSLFSWTDAPNLHRFAVAYVQLREPKIIKTKLKKLLEDPM